MKSARIIGLVLVGFVFGAGCEKSGTTAAPPPVEQGEPTRAQPKLRTLNLLLGSEVMITEIARSEKEVRTGMMFRTNLAENAGMLFVFPYPHRTSFYMKNTLVPLSCAYIDPDGTILEMLDMKPKDETPLPASSDRIQFVLEVNQGWFQRHKIAIGTIVRTEKGSLQQTFGGR